MPAEYDVRISWSGDESFTETGDDVTERVLDRGSALSIRYGRDQARSLSPMAPGRAMFELDNSSRDYSPENSTSPLYGQVLPGRPTRIQATHDAVTYGLLRGQMDEYEVLPDITRRSVQITCLDSLARLKGVRISTGVHHGLRTGQAIGVVLDAAGWPEDLRDLDVGATTVPWFWADDGDAYELLQQLLDSEGPGSLVTVGTDGQIVFRDRHHRLIRAASTTAQATFRCDGAEPLLAPPLVYDHGLRDIINSISYRIPVRHPSGELSAVWSTQGQTAVADGQTVPISVAASTPFVGAITPVAGTDYQLSGTVQMTLSRTSGQSVTVFVKATGGPAVVTDLQLRAYALATQATVQVQAEDSTSIGQYGRRSWPSGRDPVWASLPDATAIAAIILAHRAQRLPAVTITLNGLHDTRLVQQLTRDLSDRVRIVEDETGLDADFWIEQIEHVVTQGGLSHITKFGCEKVPTQPVDVFVLGSATRGVLGTNTLGRTGLDDPSTIFVLGSATNGVLGTNLLGH